VILKSLKFIVLFLFPRQQKINTSYFEVKFFILLPEVNDYIDFR